MPKPTIPTPVTSAFLNDLTANYDRSTSDVDVVNTVSETTIYSKTIGANHLSTDRRLRLELTADYLNDSGSARNLTVRLKLGGTTITTVSVNGISASATRYAASMFFRIQAKGATNSQIIDVSYPNFSSNALLVALPVTSAIDTSVAQTLAVTVEHSAAHTSLSFRKRSVALELM
jgi:hypothetical protein